MWVHLWLQGMLIIYMNNPPIPLDAAACEERRAGIERGIIEEGRRNGGLVIIANVKHPVHHFAVTCEQNQIPLGTTRSTE